MTYWHMQLRPSYSRNAIKDVVENIFAGYIRLDCKMRVHEVSSESK
jgi:hypothetical protein